MRCYWISGGREGSVNEQLQPVKSVCAVSAVDKNFQELQVMRKVKRSPVTLVALVTVFLCINSDMYNHAAKSWKKRLRRYLPHKNVVEILLQHDKARPHRSLKTQEEISKLGWSVLPYPSHIPDLEPSDCHIFGALEDAINGEKVWEW